MKNERRERRRVTRVIKLALARIAEQDPELARLLSKSIKTGTYLSYSPDAPQPASQRKHASEAEKTASLGRKDPINR